MKWPHFAAVWNQHHKDNITNREAGIFLSDLAYFDSDFYFEDDYVVHDGLDPDEFDELWEETREMEYYMPTKNVIRETVKQRDDYEYKTPDEEAMDAFLSKYIDGDRELGDLQFEIACSCQRLRSPDEVRMMLKDAGAPLDDSAFIERFEKLYNDLRGNTHIWELQGFTPYQYQELTGEPIPYFRLPTGKKRK